VAVSLPQMGVTWTESQTLYWKQAIKSVPDSEMCVARKAEMTHPCIGELKGQCQRASPCFTFCCDSETKQLQPFAVCQPCTNAIQACSGCYPDSACSQKSTLHFLPKAQSLPPALPYVESASSCDVILHPPSVVATGSIPGVSVDTTGGESWTLDEKRFPFGAQLDEDRLKLWWSVDMSKAVITFAVRAKTTGWVGIGISPNGKMPGSDIFMGWVSSAGKPIFADRFASRRSMPAIDPSQDWQLIGASESMAGSSLKSHGRFAPATLQTIFPSSRAPPGSFGRTTQRTLCRRPASQCISGWAPRASIFSRAYQTSRLSART
jgi:hypothetical protein